MPTVLAASYDETDTLYTPEKSGPEPADMVQHYMGALAFCETPQDIIKKIQELIEPASVEYLENNKNSLYMLGTVWINAIYRNVFMRDGTYFPLELLVIPPLFSSLGWKFERDSGWEALRNVFNVSDISKNAPQEEILQSLMMGTFIDALFSSPETALEKAAKDFSILKDRDDYTAILLSTGTLFGQYGWFFNTKR